MHLLVILVILLIIFGPDTLLNREVLLEKP